MLISETDGAAAGFAKLIEFNVGRDKCGCILWIAVHPAYRRRGVALNLTNAGMDYLKMRGARAVFASTQRGNKAELAALSRAGFKRVDFGDLRRLFGWRLFRFYLGIWFVPGEVVFMHS